MNFFILSCIKRVTYFSVQIKIEPPEIKDIDPEDNAHADNEERVKNFQIFWKENFNKNIFTAGSTGGNKDRQSQTKVAPEDDDDHRLHPDITEKSRTQILRRTKNLRTARKNIKSIQSPPAAERVHDIRQRMAAAPRLGTSQ